MSPTTSSSTRATTSSEVEDVWLAHATSRARAQAPDSISPQHARKLRGTVAFCRSSTNNKPLPSTHKLPENSPPTNFPPQCPLKLGCRDHHVQRVAMRHPGRSLQAAKQPTLVLSSYNAITSLVLLAAATSASNVHTACSVSYASNCMST